ncbi:MAG: right-handed parallel beta-helix repeat-containing protein [Pyrinomonadaceae bacterium]|nr:right-handed parallel beta-helix repeat-containing protein [Pyrinomonadaceae bacterium]
MAADLSVNNTNPACSTPGDNLFCSISGALTSALSGDTITVAPGNYSDNITVTTSNLTIVGVNTPTLHAVLFQPTVSIKATGVRFEGFEVTGGLDGIIVAGDHNMVLHNRVLDSSFDNIRVGSSFPAAPAAHNVVARNSVSGGLGGITIEGDHNKVVRNQATDTTGNGIVVSGNNNRLKRNQVRNCLCNSGFSIAGIRNSITANRAINNALNGFEIVGLSRKNRLLKNVAIGNGAFGFHDIFGGRNTYRRNLCKRNGAGGSLPSGLCAPQR